MTDKRLAEISESACIRHAALTQVPSKFDPRVKECNDEIGELIDHCLSQRFRANNFQSRLASAESRIDRLEAENSELRKDKSRLGFSVSYEFDDRSTAERLGMSAEAIRQQEDAIRNFAFYVANCTPLEGMSVAIQTFAPNEDQPANGK